MSGSAPYPGSPAIADAATPTGRGIRIGVIDSGWDRTITDPRVEPGIGLVDPDDELALRLSEDDHDRIGHGTSCVDLILRVAPKAGIVPIRVFGSRLETSPGIIVAAIDWAVQAGLHLVNLSLGTVLDDACEPLYRACERARAHDVVIVAAAGGRAAGGWIYPAVFDGVIGVESTTTGDPFEVQYRPGHAFECGARGMRQRTRGLGARPVVVSGTSFAAPVVTGHVARLLEGQPRLGIDGVRDLLARRPRSTHALSGSGSNARADR